MKTTQEIVYEATIEIPKGYQIDSFDKETGKVTFKEIPKEVTDRIKTVADVLADNGLTQEEFDKNCAGLSEDEKAYRLLKLIVKSLNEGWVPDWKNDEEYKYFPWFEMGGSSGFQFYDCDLWRSGSDVGSRLCFKSRELAEYAGKNFEQVYKTFFLIP